MTFYALPFSLRLHECFFWLMSLGGKIFFAFASLIMWLFFQKSLIDPFEETRVSSFVTLEQQIIQCRILVVLVNFDHLLDKFLRSRHHDAAHSHQHLIDFDFRLVFIQSCTHLIWLKKIEPWVVLDVLDCVPFLWVSDKNLPDEIHCRIWNVARDRVIATKNLLIKHWFTFLVKRQVTANHRE